LFKLYHFACKPQLLELRHVYFFVNSAAIASKISLRKPKTCDFRHESTKFKQALSIMGDGYKKILSKTYCYETDMINLIIKDSI